MRIVLEGGSEDGRVIEVPSQERTLLVPVPDVSPYPQELPTMPHTATTVLIYRITDRGSARFNAVVFELVNVA